MFKVFLSVCNHVFALLFTVALRTKSALFALDLQAATNTA